LVLEQPVVYFADVDAALHGQLRAPALVEDLERLTGLAVERRAEGVALVDPSRRLTDVQFPAGGTVAQAGLLLCARIAEYLGGGRGRYESLPAPTGAERLAETARRLDAALPERGRVAELLDEVPRQVREAGGAEPEPGERAEAGAEVRYPFLTDAWLRAALRKLVAEFGAGMAEKQAADPDRLLSDALSLLDAMGLVRRVDGGALVLPLLARYRSVSVQVRQARTQQAARVPAARDAPGQQTLFPEPEAEPGLEPDPSDGSDAVPSGH
jgi:hypothetical protein